MELAIPAERQRLLRRLFFASGATSLIYEIVFQKLASYVFGTTAWSTAAVLSSFMAGLAIGSFVGGRLADRVRRPLLWYAGLELAIGAYALAVPALFGLIQSAYVGLYRNYGLGLEALVAARALLAGVVMIAPAIFMGATFPLVVRHAQSEGGDVRSLLARLYSTNTFGATTGTAAATYLLMPYLGVWGTIAVAVAGNLAIFLFARRWAHSVGERANDAAPAEPAAATAPLALLYTVALLSGLVSFVYEVAWTHVLAVIVGTSVYAFGNMLCAFLIGVAIGSRWLDRLGSRDRLLMLGALQAGAGAAVACTTWLWDRLPQTFKLVGYMSPGFLAREGTRFGVSLLVMIVPTILLGAAFPVLLDLARRRRALGRSLGTVYSLNTIGAIVGSALTGFYLLERLGGQRTLESAALVSLGIGLLCLRAASPSPQRIRLAAVMTVLAVLPMLVAPRWSPVRLLTGQNVYFGSARAIDQVLFLREDVHGGITSVSRRPDGVLDLLTNGKFQGNDGPEMEAQIGFAHDPMLFVHDFERALVIGLGTGTSLGVFAGYPFRHIDVAEISPGIEQAARRHFHHVNRGALEDPRVQVVHEDGRNFLLLHDRRYDMIQIELANVWFAGAANLYSRDFYQLCRRRLGARGVLLQWVQLHHIDPYDILVILNTMQQAFGHVMLFVSGSQGMALASGAPLEADYSRLRSLTDRLRPLGLLDQLPARDLSAQLGDLLLDEQAVTTTIEREVGRYLGPRLMRHFASSDLYPWLEYSTPKGNAMRDTRDLTIAFLSRHRGNRRPPVRGVPDEPAWDRLQGLVAARRGDHARALYHFARLPPASRDGLEEVTRQAERLLQAGE